jgi:chaperonin GroEL
MKKVQVGASVGQEIKKGVNELASIVKITLGPKGKNVLIQGDTGPMIVNDGITIAKSVFLPDKLQNLGAQMVKEVCFLTNALAGDGTTTGIVIAETILNLGMDCKEEFNVLQLKEELTKCCDTAIAYLKTQIKNVETDEDILNIARISSGGDEEVSQKILEAFNGVERKGHVVVRDGRNYNLELDVVKGMVYDRGYISKFFVNAPEKKSILKNAYVVYVAGELTAAVDVLNLLECAAADKRPIFIIAEDVKSEALGIMVENNHLGLCAIQCPGIKSEQREIMMDMMAFTGGTLLNEAGSISTLTCDATHFGTATNIEVTFEKFLLENTRFNKKVLKERVAYVKKLVDKTKDEFFQDMYQNRLAKLNGGLAVIFAGHRSDVAANEKKLRIEDAINAVRSSLENGYLPGGGMALFDYARIIPFDHAHTVEHRIARDIFHSALLAPLNQIILNCGLVPAEIVDKILREKLVAKIPKTKELEIGYDAMKNEVCNIVQRGIIDPANVTISALENAVAVAGIVLTTGGSITNLSDEKERHPLFGG